MAVKFTVEGMDEIIRSLKKMGEVPQRHVTKAAKQAMSPTLKAARAQAPELTGDLKKGIMLKAERSKLKGKKVYRIVFDPRMNDIFQKPNALGEVTGYYPVSQEYGFFAKNGRYIPGYAFTRDPFNANQAQISQTIVKVMGDEIEKAMK